MRKFLVALILLIGVVFLIGHFAELQAIADTLRKGQLLYLSLAVLVQLLWLMNLGYTYRAIFRALGIRSGAGRLLLLGTAANFVNVVAPSAGMGGVAVFVAESNRQGYSPARATLASVLFVIYEYAGFLVVLAFGLGELFRRNNLNLTEIVASSVLLILAFTMVALMTLGMRSARQLGATLAWSARQINRLLRPVLHRDYLSEDRAREFARDAAGGLHELRRTPRSLVLPAAHSLCNKSLLLLVLTLIFLAFEAPLSAGTLVAGFSIGYLFTIVSPTPMGIGVVEGAMALTLNSLGVPLSAAAVVTLAYRGVTFWLPMLIGMLAFRRLEAAPASAAGYAPTYAAETIRPLELSKKAAAGRQTPGARLNRPAGRPPTGPPAPHRPDQRPG